MKELRERAREWIQKRPEIFHEWGRGMADEILAAFASSIQEEAQQTVLSKIALSPGPYFCPYIDGCSDPSHPQHRLTIEGISNALRSYSKRAETAEQQIVELETQRDLARQARDNWKERAELARALMEQLIHKWRQAKNEGDGPTDRFIGLELCADDLEAVLRAASKTPGCGS